MATKVSWFGSVVLVLALMVGCAPAAPGEPSAAERAKSPPAAQQRKTITVAARNSVKGFSPWLIGTTGGGARSLFEIHTNGLVSTDAAGGFQGRLAAGLPSTDDGTLVITPDGRMETTWQLRSGVKWHDGVDLTAEDIVFSWEVLAHPEMPVPASRTFREIDAVTAIDRLSFTINWKRVFYDYRDLSFVELWPFPRHLLRPAFAAGDIEAFLGLAYWTSEYVHLGAFRVTDWGLGERLVLERFDSYFLGVPRVDQIIVEIIPDENTLFANLQAGTVDIATESTLDAELMARLREEWRRTGEGTVVEREGNWSFVNIQHNPEFARVPELSRDLRIRRGLLLALDRAAVADAVLPGFANTSADTFMRRSDPRAALVATPFGIYGYEPARAVRELAEAGWRREAGGRVVNPAGRPVQLSLRGTAGGSKEVSIIAQYWRDLGLEVEEEIMHASLMADRPFRATFPVMEVTAQGANERVLTRFYGPLCPRPPRFAGAQGGCYQNPELDRLIDRLFGLLDQREQGLTLREIGELMARELPALPIYFSVQIAAVRARVAALVDDFGGGAATGQTSRNAHLWDRT